MAGEFSAGDVTVTITADTSGLTEGVDQTKSKLQELEQQATSTSSVGQQLESGLKNAAAATDTLAASAGNAVSAITALGPPTSLAADAVERLIAQNQLVVSTMTGVEAEAVAVGQAFNSQLTGELLAGKLAPAVGVVEDIGAALLKVAPAAGVAGAGTALFVSVLGTLTENAKIASEAIDKIYTGKTTGQLADQISQLSRATELAGSGLSTLEQKTILDQEKIFSKAANSPDFVAQGTVAADQAAVAALNVQKAYQQVEAESQKAGAALDKNINAGIDEAVGGVDKLVKGLQQADPSEEFSRLKTLANQLDFAGPLTDLKQIDGQIQSADQKIRQLYADAAKKIGAPFDDAAVQADIDRVNALIKANFKGELVLKAQLDEASLQAELSKVPKVVDILMRFNGQTSAEAAEFARTNPAEARATAQVLQETANLRQPGAQAFPLSGGQLGEGQSGTADIYGSGSGSVQDYVNSGQLKFSADVQASLDAAQSLINSNPLEVPVNASGSPTLPFSEYFNTYAPGVLSSFAGGVPDLTFGTNATNEEAFAKRFGASRLPSAAFDLLSQGASASPAAVAKEIYSLQEAKRFYDYREATDSHLMPLLSQTEGFLPGAADISRALGNLIAQLQALVTQSGGQVAAQKETTAAVHALGSVFGSGRFIQGIGVGVTRNQKSLYGNTTARIGA